LSGQENFRLSPRPPNRVGERKPNIKSLVRREDVEGLLKAAMYRELASGSDGTRQDLGIPVRAEAILALGALAPEQGEPAITRALRDPADRVRCEAVRVLHALREAGALTQAVQWLPQKGHSRKLAFQAIMDLRELVRPSAVADALVHRDDEDLLGEDEADVILALLEGERPDVTDEVLELLVSALGDERGIVVDRAAEMLVSLAPDSIDGLVDELHMGSHPGEAAYVLGRIGDPHTLDPLVNALRHPEPKVRAESAAALAELQDPAAVAPLLDATGDPEHRVRTQASAALDRMGTTAVIFGVAALLRPAIEEATRSAIPLAEVEGNGRQQAPRSRARKQYRSRRSNGGPREAVDPQSRRSNGGPPEAADPRPPGQESVG
jgi:HEAT repeat protein